MNAIIYLFLFSFFTYSPDTFVLEQSKKIFFHPIEEMFIILNDTRISLSIKKLTSTNRSKLWNKDKILVKNLNKNFYGLGLNY